MYQVYSRRSPQTGVRSGPRMSIASRSSSTYCCSFFQLSSRRASTRRMNASRSVCAATRNPVPLTPTRRHTPAVVVERSRRRVETATRLTISDVGPRAEVSLTLGVRRSLEQERLEHVGPRFFVGRDDGDHVGD